MLCKSSSGGTQTQIQLRAANTSMGRTGTLIQMDKEQRAGAVYRQPVIMRGFVAEMAANQTDEGISGAINHLFKLNSELEPSLKFNKSVTLSDISLRLNLTLLPVCISFT